MFAYTIGIIVPARTQIPRFARDDSLISLERAFRCYAPLAPLLAFCCSNGFCKYFLASSNAP